MTILDEAQKPQIAIVGAGPAGLAMALALAGKNIQSIIIGPPSDQADTRTTALWDSAIETLGRIGGWQMAKAKAAPLRTITIIDATKHLIRARPVTFAASEVGLDAFGYNIANGDLVAGLEIAARTHPLISRLEDRVTALATQPEQVRVVMQNGNELTVRLVIAADGRKSMIRDAVGIRATTWDYPQAALTLTVRHSLPHDDTSIEFHTETGPFTMVPLPNSPCGDYRSAIVCVVGRQEANWLETLDTRALAIELERRSYSRFGSFTVEDGRSIWPLGGLKVDRLAHRRVALIGEAAHAFPPIGAQGFNLTVRDIETLADLASQGSDPGRSSVLAAYSQARHGDVWLRTQGADLLNRSLLSSFLPFQSLRAFGFTLLGHIQPLRRLMIRTSLGRIFSGGAGAGLHEGDMAR